jgi:hypothetical protein
MAFIIGADGNHVDVTPKMGPQLYTEAASQNLTVAELLNQTFPEANANFGTAAEQIFASEGLALVGRNKFGLRNVTTAELLTDRGHMAAGNVKDNGAPFGSASRILFPAALIPLVEASVAKDYATDGQQFDRMVAQNLSIATENFEQPVIDYGTKNGPEQAKAQRMSQFSMPPVMMRFGTTNRPRKLPTYGIMLEFSDQALRATTLDMVALTVNRYMAVEKDARIYDYISSLFNGNGDNVIGAVTPVTTTSLDSAATGGVLTHKAWVKFLARNRKKRRITDVICDIDTYLKIETRTGRPGSNNYDPTLSRIDPQGVAQNATFGADVRIFIVDDGAVPANTLYALDSTKAITRVNNVGANYSAAEAFALRRSEAMVMHWSEDVYRLFGDTDLSPFDVLTIA